MLVVEVRLMTLGGDDELDRNRICALMQKLEEGVLAVGAGLAPYDGPVGPETGLPSTGDTLAVQFHVELLQIGGKPSRRWS